MDYKVVLDVVGVDLESEAVAEQLAEADLDLAWSDSGGRTSAAFFTQAADPVSAAYDVARRIERVVPGAKVPRVDEELMSVREIASEMSLSREAVRLWTVGRRGPGHFPRPRAGASTGDRGSVRLWAWSEVAGWLDEYLGIEPDYRYLTWAQVADLNAHLAGIELHAADVELTHMSEFPKLQPFEGAKGDTRMYRHELWDANLRTPFDVPEGVDLTPRVSYPVSRAMRAAQSIAGAKDPT